MEFNCIKNSSNHNEVSWEFYFISVMSVADLKCEHNALSLKWLKCFYYKVMPYCGE